MFFFWFLCLQNIIWTLFWKDFYLNTSFPVQAVVKLHSEDTKNKRRNFLYNRTPHLLDALDSNGSPIKDCKFDSKQTMDSIEQIWNKLDKDWFSMNQVTTSTTPYPKIVLNQPATFRHKYYPSDVITRHVD